MHSSKAKKASNKLVRRPGIEPGSKRWQRSIITTKYGSELASFRSASITNASAKEDKSSRSNILIKPASDMYVKMKTVESL